MFCATVQVPAGRLTMQAFSSRSPFFVSHYLNRLAASGVRATVLSFKGLAYNISYGFLGVLYAILVSSRRGSVLSKAPSLLGQGLEDHLFMATFWAFPTTFVILMGIFLLYAVYGDGNKGRSINKDFWEVTLEKYTRFCYKNLMVLIGSGQANNRLELFKKSRKSTLICPYVALFRCKKSIIQKQKEKETRQNIFFRTLES